MGEKEVEELERCRKLNELMKEYPWMQGELLEAMRLEYFLPQHPVKKEKEKET